MTNIIQNVAPSKQLVIDKFVVGYGSEFQFRLSVMPYNYPTKPEIQVSVNNKVVASNKYTLELINHNIYVNLEVYLAGLLASVQKVAPVVEIRTYTHDTLLPNANGYSAIPQQLEANPSQLEVGEISASNLTDQFSSIISNQLNFDGVAVGGSNNYRDSFKDRSVGSCIMQNTAPALKSMLISSSNDLDIVTSIRFSQDEYTKFKNKYLKAALQLINQEFNPVQYHTNTVVVSAWMDQIFKTINISKEFSDSFAYSYMIASGDPVYQVSAIVPSDGLVQLTDYIDVHDVRNAVYVYDTTVLEKLLIIGVDYTIVSTGTSLSIQFKLTNILPGSSVTISQYKNPVPVYIPSTPTKVGTFPASIPRIELDTSYAIPTYVIIGHDGSKTVAYNDYRDQLLLDLEKRIYNLLDIKFQNDYYVPLRIESVKAGYFRKTRYSRKEYLNITESYLNKWSAKNRANYRTNEWETLSANPAIASSSVWKLYNYTLAKTADETSLNLPGNWKGIFQFYYDTYQPDTKPWEMLGLHEQPIWWETEYGTNWSSTNTTLWHDLEKGIIRQGPSAKFNPVSLLPQAQSMWARPGLSSIIPVDAAGNIRSVMDIFNVAFSNNIYAPFDGFDNDWVYGDGGPVEQAWMATSSYAFSVQEFLYLTRPGPFGELLWDTLGTDVSVGKLTIPGVNGPVLSSAGWQYVQTNDSSIVDNTSVWMRPKNKNQYVHAELVDGIRQIRFGYQRWISDRLLFLGKDTGTEFGQKVRTLDVNLANKLAGFTNKQTTSAYIESVTPGVITSGLSIPTNNFDVLLHKGQPIKTYSYSGVIIRLLENGLFAVYGYDLLKSSFTILDRSNAERYDITIGGTPAPFKVYTPGETYVAGDIVRYNGIYYLSNSTQESSKFSAASWQKLNALPITGGLSVSHRPISEVTSTTIPYGTVLSSPQEVFDMLIGWGAYLESEGWKFDEVSAETNQINDWLYSAKQFLFWLNTNWAPDASIQLSPAATAATLTVKDGYPDTTESISNGVYSILDKFGVAISPKSTSTDRDGRTITVSPVDLSVGGIYFLQINASETEHVLIFDNSTSFGDIIFDPLLRSRQQRLRYNGFRSNGWYGKMEAPGYLILDNQLVPNYDTIVESMRYYYDPDVTIDNPSLENLGRHLIGYDEKEYLNNLQLEGDIQYMFYQGAIRQKGTLQTLDKLFRSTKIQSDEHIQVYEEWALKLADLGNTVEQVSTEFILKPEQNSGEVIVARLNFVPSTLGGIKQINILNAENQYTTVPLLKISLPDAEPTGWTTFSINDSYVKDSIVRRDDIQENPIYYSSNIDQVAGPFNPLNWTIVLQTRRARAFVILNDIGVISRIDIADSGYGYLTAPHVEIVSGTQSSQLDRLYAIWQGDIIRDEVLDNVVDIDIDNVAAWVYRPSDPAHSLEFPTTNVTDYLLPNAGYVNFDDITFSAFDVNQAVVQWGSTKFNPVENTTVWVANNFTEDWGVYKLVKSTSIDVVDVIKDDADNLLLRLPNPILPQGSVSGDTTDFGNIIVLQVIAAHAEGAIDDGTTGPGLITSITVVKTGANYVSAPAVYIDGDGHGATAIAKVLNGKITDIVVTNPGGGYTSVNITIDPPPAVNGDTNYAVGFTYAYADEYSYYYTLVTLDSIPISSNDIPEYANITTLLLLKSMRFDECPQVVPDYIESTDKVWVDNTNTWDKVKKTWATTLSNLWGVLVYTPANPNVFIPYRLQEPLIDTSLFESVQVFTGNGRRLTQLPVYDPFKNILPGMAKQNISYMSLRDPARYNVTDDIRLLNNNSNFGEAQIGKLWWDLSPVKYVYYEQPTALDGSESTTSNMVYRRDYWGKLFPGSSIDVYEWTKSDVPPAEYAKTGYPRSLTSYVKVSSTNKLTNAIEANYYFWVKNSTDKPNIENRTLAASEVSRLLASPTSQGFSYFSPIHATATNNSYMFYNVQEILSYQGNNVQVKYRMASRDDQPHTEWSFFRNGDSQCLVDDQFWNKMVDSLCGYTKVLPSTGEWSNSILVARFLPWDVYGWDIAPFDDATSTSSANIGEILPVPDPTLSEVEKYGVKYRPLQGMFVNLQSARKIFVEACNGLLSQIPIRDNNVDWDILVNSHTYWEYTTWYAAGYENAIPTSVFSTLGLANTALVNGRLETGSIVEVVNGTPDGRFIMYEVIQFSPTIAVQSFKKIGIGSSAIKLLDTLYTQTGVYNLSVELRELLDALRNSVFVNNFATSQNSLYFSMLNYVVSEQRNPDWLFKSSYIYIKENNHSLSQDALYKSEQINSIIDYINDAKPYHTQVRDYTTSSTTSDIAVGTSSDSMKSKTSLWFSPNNGGPYPARPWDADYMHPDGPNPPYTDHWDMLSWDTEPSHYYHRANIESLLNPASSYVISLTSPDPDKKGYSELYPYTVSFSSAFVGGNNLADISYIKVSVDILNYGSDYFINDNNDGSYTTYFFKDPAPAVPTLYILHDIGVKSMFTYNTTRTEVAYMYDKDSLVINVDTKLPVNEVAGVIKPYAAWGDSATDVDPVVAGIITGAGGIAVFNPADPLIEPPIYLPNTISYKQYVDINHDITFYRNAHTFAGELVDDIGAYAVDSVNPGITVFTPTNIIPEPVVGTPGAIWVNGERIEYTVKQPHGTLPNTWVLSGISRGTHYTTPIPHTAMITSLANPPAQVPNIIWVEAGNILPAESSTKPWHHIHGYDIFAYEEFPWDSVASHGGLWYANTEQSQFLKAEQGIANP